MKFFILAFVVSFSITSFSQKELKFVSAKERIIYNNHNNLDEYAGINISYTYELHLNKEATKEILEKVGRHFFHSLIEVILHEEKEVKYVTYLTEASEANNSISKEIPEILNKEFIYSKRTFQLK